MKNNLGVSPGILPTIIALFPLLPLIGSVTKADERALVWLSATKVLANPLSLFFDPIIQIPTFLDRGNFRPIARLLENINYSAVFLFSELTNSPIQLGLGLVNLASAFFLFWTVVFVARKTLLYFEVPLPYGLRILIGLLFATMMGLFGYGSSLNLFTSVYFQTASIAILLTFLATAMILFDKRDKKLTLVLLSLLGLLSASINELVYVGAAAVGLIAPLLIFYLPQLKNKIHWIFLRYLFFVASFLTVFIPSRLMANRCSSLDSCYDVSSVSLNEEALSGLFILRAFTWLPNYLFQVAGNVQVRPILLFILILGAVASFIILRRKLPLKIDAQAIGEPKPHMILILAGSTLLLVDGFMMSLSPEVQSIGWSYQFRDHGLQVGSAILLFLGLYQGIVGLWSIKRIRLFRIVHSVTLGILISSSAASLLWNNSVVDMEKSNAINYADRTLNYHLSVFVVGDLQNDLRCEAEKLHLDLYSESGQNWRHDWLMNAVNSYTNQRYSNNFCE